MFDKKYNTFSNPWPTPFSYIPYDINICTRIVLFEKYKEPIGSKLHASMLSFFAEQISKEIDRGISEELLNFIKSI